MTRKDKPRRTGLPPSAGDDKATRAPKALRRRATGEALDRGKGPASIPHTAPRAPALEPTASARSEAVGTTAAPTSAPAVPPAPAAPAPELAALLAAATSGAPPSVASNADPAATPHRSDAVAGDASHDAAAENPPSSLERAPAVPATLAAESPQGSDSRRPLAEDALGFRDRVRERRGRVELLMFRIGEELFATELARVDEAVERPDLHHLPEMAASMLGVFQLRGRLVPVYSPEGVLGVRPREEASATLILRAAGGRIGVAVDDVEDVLSLDLAAVRDAPGGEEADGVLLGVARRGHDLLAVIDADSLIAACTPTPEPA